MAARRRKPARQEAAGITCPLAQLGQALAPFDPKNPDDDYKTEHLRRLDLLDQAAPYLAVRSPEGAALALSAAQSSIMEIYSHDLSEKEIHKYLRQSARALANVTRWLRQETGAVPPRAPWPSWADPFEDEPDCSYLT